MQNVVKWTDVRSLTYQERLKIGFNEVKLKWQNAKAHFTDSALQICGHPVMEDWEKDYMKLLADIATTNHGVVLEVGFGLGLSAGYIQQNQIDKHIIMEANKGVYLKALEFAQKAKYQTDIIFGFWEDTISQVKDSSLDGILFGACPLVPDEVHQNILNVLIWLGLIKLVVNYVMLSRQKIVSIGKVIQF